MRRLFTARKPLTVQQLADLFSHMQPDLQAVGVRRTGNPETAADLVHEVFLKLQSIRTPLYSDGEARAYIYRMMQNLAIDHVRTESRRSAIIDGAQILFEDAVMSPEAIAISRDQLRRIDRALGDLPPKCREAFVMTRVTNLTHKEIADRLGVSVSLIEKYQLRALRHCRDFLANDLQ